MNAYVLVQTDANSEPIAGLLRAVPGVLFAEDVRGPYDALALARSDSSKGTLQEVLAQVRELPGVIRALPAPLVPSTTAAQHGEAA